MRTPRIVASGLGLLLIATVISIWGNAALRTPDNVARKNDPFRRPAPTKPVKPELPGADRSQENRVFLENADSLFRPAGEIEEFQVVKGNVRFRQGGMWMFCDSAYYYPAKNSMDAFGHVEMRQGDTLFVFADKLFYDGLARHATLTHGPSRSNVELRNRNVSLTTDSLDYDLNMETGWYSTGGVLRDDINQLTSGYGEYSPATKQAKFRRNVVLENNKDGYRLLTEELDYNTASHIADINTLTKIEGKNDTILTTRGWYDTVKDHAQLTSRSTILHSDSSRNVTTLEGDSIIYDRATHMSRAYMFRTPGRHAAPMVITDTARKVQLVGGYGEFNDSTREAMAAEYPLLMEFSRPDTLFLRADTVRSWIEALDLDTVAKMQKEYHVARAIGRARFFNTDIQGVADTLLIKEVDSMLYMIHKPIIWAGERQIYGNRINVHFNDSVPDRADLPEWGLAAEHIAENFYDQLTGAVMRAWLEDKRLKRLEVDGSVTAIMLPQEKDSSYNKIVRAESSYLTLEMDSTQVKHLKMWPEVSGTVTPIFDVKGGDAYIQGFQWWDMLRPERGWYGDRVRWIDHLGDTPEALDEYFAQPPLFKPVVRALPAAPAQAPGKPKEEEGEDE